MGEVGPTILFACKGSWELCTNKNPNYRGTIYASTLLVFGNSDCSMIGSPDITPRQDCDETLVKAFETYKKKDSSKGT